MKKSKLINETIDIPIYNYSIFSTLIDNINKDLIMPATRIVGNRLVTSKVDAVMSILSVAIIIYLQKNKNDVDKTYKTILTKIIPLFAFYNSYYAFINNIENFKLTSEKRRKNELYNYINFFLFVAISYFVVTQVEKNIDTLTEKYPSTFKKIDTIIAPEKIKTTFAQTINFVDNIFSVFLFSYYISSLAIYLFMKLISDKEDISFSDIQFKSFIRNLLNERIFISLAALKNFENLEMNVRLKNKEEIEKLIHSKEIAKEIKRIVTKNTNIEYDKEKSKKPLIKKKASTKLTNIQKNISSDEKLVAMFHEDVIYYNNLTNTYLLELFHECVEDVANGIYQRFGRNYLKYIISNIELYTRKGSKCGVINGYSTRNSLTIIVSYNDVTCSNNIESLKKEIRSVLAHEFAHSFLAHRYYFRSIIMALSTNKWYKVIPASTIWVSVLADYICFLYERQNELEADALAVEILNNDDIIHFLSKTLEREGEHNSSILRAHGTLEQRIISAKHTYELLMSKQKQYDQTSQ